MVRPDVMWFNALGYWLSSCMIVVHIQVSTESPSNAQSQPNATGHQNDHNPLLGLAWEWVTMVKTGVWLCSNPSQERWQGG